MPNTSRGPTDKETLKHKHDIIMFQLQEEERKRRVGPDRRRNFDDVYSSQINIGTENQILPSHHTREPPNTEFMDKIKNSTVKVIDLKPLEREPAPIAGTY